MKEPIDKLKEKYTSEITNIDNQLNEFNEKYKIKPSSKLRDDICNLSSKKITLSEVISDLERLINNRF